MKPARRVALVHDWLTGMRGGEKVLLSLLRLFPDAPIFTLLHVKGSVSAEIEERPIHTSFVQHLPAPARLYRHYLPLFPRAAAGLDLSGFDLVISSSHCVAKGVAVPAGAVHVCYCHTPMRYVWDRFDDYFGPERLSAPLRFLVGRIARRLRAWDVATAPGVDQFVANSAYVAKRIERYYARGSEVIHPPVDTAFFSPAATSQPGRYDLVVSALAPYKRLELVLEAYRESSTPLKIVGTGPEASRLAAAAPPSVELLGRLSDPELREAYRGARAVIMPGVEDFGIVPLEAMACGRPAVVFAEGGGPESVVVGETGLTFAEPTAASLRAAVDALSTMRFNIDVLRARAEQYSTQLFESRFTALVERVLVASAGPAAEPSTPC